MPPWVTGPHTQIISAFRGAEREAGASEIQSPKVSSFFFFSFFSGPNKSYFISTRTLQHRTCTEEHRPDSAGGRSFPSFAQSGQEVSPGAAVTHRSCRDGAQLPQTVLRCPRPRPPEPVPQGSPRTAAAAAAASSAPTEH